MWATNEWHASMKTLSFGTFRSRWGLRNDSRWLQLSSNWSSVWAQSQCDLEVPAQERRTSAGLPGSSVGTRVPSCQYDWATGFVSGERRDAPDVARVAIDGHKWIASRFHPNLLSEKLIGNITHHQESIQEQHLQALKNILAKRKRRIEKEEKSKAEGQLGLVALKPLTHWTHTRLLARLGAIFRSRWQYAGVRSNGLDVLTQ